MLDKFLNWLLPPAKPELERAVYAAIGHIRPKAGAPITSPANPYYHLMKEKFGSPASR